MWIAAVAGRFPKARLDESAGRRPEPISALVVVAKGYDGVAQRIKQIVAENGITMVENIKLARALAKEVEIGRAIPVKWYAAVAEVLAMVYRLKKAG